MIQLRSCQWNKSRGSMTKREREDTTTHSAEQFNEMWEPKHTCEIHRILPWISMDGTYISHQVEEVE